MYSKFRKITFADRANCSTTALKHVMWFVSQPLTCNHFIMDWETSFYADFLQNTYWSLVCCSIHENVHTDYSDLGIKGFVLGIRQSNQNEKI